MFAQIFTADEFTAKFSQFNMDTQPLEAIECLFQTHKDFIAPFEIICAEYPAIVK